MSKLMTNEYVKEIQQVIKIQHYSRFDLFHQALPADGKLEKINLIYGPNGSGKTALSLIAQSLATRKDDIIVKKENKFLLKPSLPKIELLANNNTRIIFSNGHWNSYLTGRVKIFNSYFISNNVYIFNVEDNGFSILELMSAQDAINVKKLLKEQIESEEVLNAKIINLEKDLELLQKRYEEQEKIMLSSKEKIEGLEVDNKNYIALNSQLVSKENDYINQLREKDSVINSKDVEINKLVNDYESKLKSLEEQYKAKIEQLEKDNKATVKDFESKLIESDKEKAVLESKIESLTNNVTSLNTENKELKANIELVRKEAKEDIKTLEKEHKIEIKALEKEVANAKETNNKIALEKAKLESKIENLENNINALNETKKNLETEIKACSDSLKNKDIEISNKEKEIEKINGALADAKVELEKMVKENKKIQTNLDKVNKENKDLKAEINKFEKGVK